MEEHLADMNAERFFMVIWRTMRSIERRDLLRRRKLNRFVPCLLHFSFLNLYPRVMDRLSFELLLIFHVSLKKQ